MRLALRQNIVVQMALLVITRILSVQSNVFIVFLASIVGVICLLDQLVHVLLVIIVLNLLFLLLQEMSNLVIFVILAIIVRMVPLFLLLVLLVHLLLQLVVLHFPNVIHALLVSIALNLVHLLLSENVQQDISARVVLSLQLHYRI
jgi:hypothetical protein